MKFLSMLGRSAVDFLEFKRIDSNSDLLIAKTCTFFIGAAPRSMRSAISDYVKNLFLTNVYGKLSDEDYALIKYSIYLQEYDNNNFPTVHKQLRDGLRLFLRKYQHKIKQGLTNELAGYLDTSSQVKVTPDQANQSGPPADITDKQSGTVDHRSSYSRRGDPTLIEDYYPEGLVERLHISADHGDLDSQACLAELYLEAWKESNDGEHFAEGLHYYRCAADQGSAEAQYQVALLADDYTIYENSYQALIYLRLAADQGHALASAHLESLDNLEKYVLGFMYETGDGVDLDIDEAISWYRLAIEGSGGELSPWPNYRLGCIYAEGRGVQQSFSAALENFQLAINRNCKLARDHNGQLMKNNSGSFVWESTQQFGPAEYMIGTLYEAGLGVPQNSAMALSWYLRASTSFQSCDYSDSGHIEESVEHKALSVRIQLADIDKKISRCVRPKKL